MLKVRYQLSAGR